MRIKLNKFVQGFVSLFILFLLVFLFVSCGATETEKVIVDDTVNCSSDTDCENNTNSNVKCNLDTKVCFTEEEAHYDRLSIIACQKGFECDVNDAKAGKSDVSECTSGGAASPICTGMFKGTFVNTNTDACAECYSALTCDKFFEDNVPTGYTYCEICKTMCEY